MNFRVRKATDVNRLYPTFELLADDAPILDVGFSDNGTFEVAFNAKIAGVVIAWAELQELIDRGKHLAELDRL